MCSVSSITIVPTTHRGSKGPPVQERDWAEKRVALGGHRTCFRKDPKNNFNSQIRSGPLEYRRNYPQHELEFMCRLLGLGDLQNTQHIYKEAVGKRQTVVVNKYESVICSTKFHSICESFIFFVQLDRVEQFLFAPFHFLLP